MHVLDRSQLPRLVRISIAAAILTILISLTLARGLSSFSPTSDNASMFSRHTPAASPSTLQTVAPRWVRDPFASLLSRPLAQPWFTPRG